MPIPFLIVFFLIVIAVAFGYTYMMRKATQRETAYNQPIAEANGVKLIEAAGAPPKSMFKLGTKDGAIVRQIAVDPKTGDMSYQISWSERPLVYVRGSNDFINYNLAIAIVTTGFWVEQSVTIETSKRLSRKKHKHQTGDAAIDDKYQVRSKDAAAAEAIATPALMNAIDNPPFPMKDWVVHFLGPQVMVRCDVVEFEKRIQLMRWAQTLPGLVSTSTVPGYGSYTVQVGQITDTVAPTVDYIPAGNHTLTPVVDDYDPTADLDESDGVPSDA